MNKKLLCKICLILVLVFLVVHLGVTFVSAVHTNCCVQACIPCLNLAKFQDLLRQFSGALLAPAGFLLLLFLLQALTEGFLSPQNISLVAQKARLNN